MLIRELLSEGRAQEIVHKNPMVGTLKALAKNNKYGSARFVIYKGGTVVASDSEHFTHHSMAPAMGAWDVRGYVQHLGNNDYAYRSMNIYDPMPKDHPIFRKWESMGVENGNDENTNTGFKSARNNDEVTELAENQSNGIKFKTTKGKNKFSLQMLTQGEPIGIYQYDANTGRSIAEIYPEFKGKGFGKLLILNAIYTAAKFGLDFQEDESRTAEYDNVLDRLSDQGYIVGDEGNWYVTDSGEQFLKQSLTENFADGKGPGRPGDSQRHGILKKASMAQLEKAAKATGRKGQLARWQLNMRRGKKKVNEEKYTVDRNGIQLSVSIDGATVEVRPMHDNKQLGYVVFDRDGKTLVADDLSIDDEYRGKGIAKIIYDYIKELGFIIKRSSDQTSSGKKYWDKHAGEQGKIWEDNTLEDDDRKQMIADFVKFALKQLDCDHKPKIKLVTDNKTVQNFKSFGGTNIHNGEIWVYVGNRNLADILRTLCHEMVHYKQFKDGRIKGPEDGKTGSELENEANAKAGIILRHYGKMKPAIFESK